MKTFRRQSTETVQCEAISPAEEYGFWRGAMPERLRALQGGIRQSCAFIVRRSLIPCLYRYAGQFPRGAVLDQARNQGRVHGVAGALSHHSTFNAAPRKREIADQIQHL